MKEMTTPSEFWGVLFSIIFVVGFCIGGSLDPYYITERDIDNSRKWIAFTALVIEFISIYIIRSNPNSLQVVYWLVRWWGIPINYLIIYVSLTIMSIFTSSLR